MLWLSLLRIGARKASGVYEWASVAGCAGALAGMRAWAQLLDRCESSARFANLGLEFACV